VVVLDNASSDCTPLVVAQAQSDFPNVLLRSVRRETNIGPDANFCDAPHQAQGQFLLLVSDDDILLPGAVALLLDLIRENPEMDAVALNTRPFRDTPAEETAGVYRIPADLWLRGRDDALSFLGAHVTFLSCIAFRRANVLGRDYSAYFATNLAQCYLFLDALAPGHGMYATRQPYLAQRADNNSGFDFFQVFVTHYHDLLCHARKIGYSKPVVERLIARQLRFVVYFVAAFKSKGTLGQLRPNYWNGFVRLWIEFTRHELLWLLYFYDMGYFIPAAV
jgi:glycosyltransferase involved in cell wall biosynthesis